MSALGRYFRACGLRVSGSDIADSPLLKELRREGIKINIGHKSSNLPKMVNLAVYSQAVNRNNPELAAASKLNIKTVSYPEAIGDLTRRFKTIAVAGSHGKSTTTALVALTLIRAGYDPTVIVGTRLKELNNSNFRQGKSDWLVLEADEYGRAFRYYSPFAAIVTNIDREHLDIYKNIAGVKKSFLKFISNIRENGELVLNQADKNIKSLKKQIQTIARVKRAKIIWYGTNPLVKKCLAPRRSPVLFGRHNISNASAVYALGAVLGIKSSVILKTLENYKGAWRRLEYRDELRIMNNELRKNSASLPLGRRIIHNSGFIIPVYDDYAHHPTEIKASLAALREKYPAHKIICVFQPHQQERLQRLFSEFRDAFTDADALILLDVYRVAGRERKPESGIEKLESRNSKQLSDAIKKKYPQKEILYLKNPNALKKTISLVASGYSLSPILVMMGAGNIVKYTDQLLSDKKK